MGQSRVVRGCLDAATSDAGAEPVAANIVVLGVAIVVGNDVGGRIHRHLTQHTRRGHAVRVDIDDAVAACQFQRPLSRVVVGVVAVALVVGHGVQAAVLGPEQETGGLAIGVPRRTHLTQVARPVPQQVGERVAVQLVDAPRGMGTLVVAVAVISVDVHGIRGAGTDLPVRDAARVAVSHTHIVCHGGVA